MRFLWSSFSISFVIGSVMSASFARAADDDIVFDSADAANASIETIILEMERDAEHQFTLYLDTIDRECSLTIEQKKKAQLAVRRDIRLLGQALIGGNTPQHMTIRQIVLAQAEQNVRLTVKPAYFFREGTFVSKVLVKHLTAEQRCRFEAYTEADIKNAAAFRISR